MENTGLNQSKLQRNDSWTPQTPNKPDLPNVIYTDIEGNQLQRQFWLGSEGYSTCFNAETIVPSARELLNSFHFKPATNFGGGACCIGTCSLCSYQNANRWENVPLTSLLALANAASTPQTDGVFSLGSNSWIHYDFMNRKHYDFGIPQTPAHDLYSRPEISNRFYSKASQFAPATVDNITNWVFEKQNESTDSQEGLNAGAIFGTNCLQSDKETPITETMLSSATNSNPIEENNNPEDGQPKETSKTPQQKVRRKKHRPKVIKEGKPSKPRPSQPAYKENTKKRKNVRKCTEEMALNGEMAAIPPNGKRKYVRKKAAQNSSTNLAELSGKTVDQETVEPVKNSCRRTLNFDEEEQAVDGSTKCDLIVDPGFPTQARNVTVGDESSITVHVGKGVEVVLGTVQVGQAFDLTQLLDQMQKAYMLSAQLQAQKEPVSNTTGLSCKEQQESLECNSLGNQVSNSAPEREDVMLQFEREQPDPGHNNLAGIGNNNLPQHWVDSSMNIPIISKKKTGEEKNTTSSSPSAVVLPAEERLRVESTHQEWNSNKDSSLKVSCWTAKENADGLMGALKNGYAGLLYDLQSAGNTLIQTQKLSKKRSRSCTKVQDLAVLNKTPCAEPHPYESSSEGPGNCDGKQNASSIAPQTSMKALITKMHAPTAKKRRTKKIVFLSKEAVPQEIITFNNQHNFPNTSGTLPGLLDKQKVSIDVITEQLQHLDIHRESTYLFPTNENALVPYGDGTIVPFEPAKRRRARAKVDLDEETNRVWKLLLQNISSEGVDGTDEQNTKYWKDEREIFTGRSNSFIARMRLVQGDRRFSPWKGSVVDSVVGVFLTQNVSDHLSSSAFMSLASNFPLKTKYKVNTCCDESASSVVEMPIIEIDDPINVAKWSEEMTNQSIYVQSPISLHVSEFDDEIEVVNSNEPSESSSRNVASITPLEYYESVADRSSTEISEINKVCSFGEGATTTTNSSSLLTSALSSQNFVAPPVQAAERKESYLLNNSETNDSTSRSELHNLSCGTSFVELLRKACTPILHEVYCHENSIVPSDKNSKDDYDRHRSVRTELQRENIENSNSPQSFLGESVVTSSNYCFGHTNVSGLGNSKMTMHEKMDHDNIKWKSVDHLSSKTVDEKQNLSEEIPDFTESTSGNQERSPKDLTESLYQEKKEFDGMDEAKRKAKSRRVGREIRDNVDWDDLRKEAEANGKKREKTESTMDSLDWEAVRTADVNEIANTIKERGMNNRLAARIKDFLNRLHRDHGNVDLEWLRDVPPDKAKEYLLSIKGLGLKSVECVRLLTLHHVAFPVDTNVGRIVVRLGWVPLQPLPESLQLHLLELLVLSNI